MIRGTARSFEPQVRDLIERRIATIAEGIAMAHEMQATPVYTRLYPAMYNTPERVQEARAIAAQCLGEDCVKTVKRTPGGEDFSFMLLQRPGCLFRLGNRDAEHDAPVHNERFNFNDKAIATGAAVLLSVALTRMSN